MVLIQLFFHSTFCRCARECHIWNDTTTYIVIWQHVIVWLVRRIQWKWPILDWLATSLTISIRAAVERNSQSNGHHPKYWTTHDSHRRVMSGHMVRIKTHFQLRNSWKITALNRFIWNFPGVLMWEVFTCGKMPYGRLKNTEVVERVQRGIILERPKACAKEIYEVSSLQHILVYEFFPWNFRQTWIIMLFLFRLCDCVGSTSPRTVHRSVLWRINLRL